MQSLTLRHNPIGLSVFLLVLVAPLSLLCGLGCCLSVNGIAESAEILEFVFWASFLILALSGFIAFGAFAVLSVLSMMTKVTICGDTVTWIRPFRKERTLPISEITCWGYNLINPKVAYLFFCTEDRNVFLSYLDSHWDQCVRLFKEEKVNRLKCSEEGLFHLALGTYVSRLSRFDPFITHDNLLVLWSVSDKRLQKLAAALKKDGILTGPCGITPSEGVWREDIRSLFEKYAKYRGEND